MTAETCQVDVKLTTMQRLFVDKYVSCLNATKSALAAGYSQGSARQIASQLLKNVNVKTAIEQRLKAKVPENSEITPIWIRKTVKDTIADCQNPKDKFIGLELLARVTPGTLEPLPAQTTTINFMTILGKLGNVQSPVEVIASPSAGESAVTLTHPPAKSMPANSLNTSTTSDAISLNTLSDVESTKSNSAGNGQPPHDPSVSENTPTQKFVTQKIS